MNLQSAAGNFTIRNSLVLSDGALAGSGTMTVGGRVNLSRGLLRDQCRLVLKDFCELNTPLRFDGNAILVVSPGATLAVAQGGEFLRLGGEPELRNEGVIRIWSRAPSIPFILLRNFGTVTTFASTLDFQTGAATDLIQEDGGYLGLGSSFTDVATLNAKAWFKAGSAVVGDAHIREARVEGTVQGRLSFDRLTLGSTAVIRYDLEGLQDSLVAQYPLTLTAQSPLTLGGRLEVGLLHGFRPGPDAVFRIMSSGGAINAQFAIADFGRRISLTDGTGSFLLTRSSDSNSVVLSRFLPPAIELGEAQLDYRLPEAAGQVGGSFIVPHPAINLPAGDWAGGTLKVEIAMGFDTAIDSLEFRRNPTFPEGDAIGVQGLLNGEQTLSFRGTVFGTNRLTAGRMTCALNGLAQNEAIVALLGGLFYRNTDLTSDWFVEPDALYPPRTIQITLTDRLGTPKQVSLGLLFPHLVGISLPDRLFLPNSQTATLLLTGEFSNEQILPVRYLMTTWRDGCDSHLLAGSEPDFPGEQKVKGFINGNYCCAAEARSGSRLVAQIQVYRFVDFPIEMDTRDCVIAKYNLAPECELPPGAGLLRENPQPSISQATFHALQALMKESFAGRRLVDLYWQHTAEVVKIVFSNALLRDQTKALLTTFQPGISALLAGQGEEVSITQPMIDQLNSVWNGIAQKASPTLRAALQEEQTRFDGFRRFVDRGFSRWADLLALPVPTEPVVFISGVTRAGGRFSVEVNDVPGAALSFWRSLNLTVWEQVPNAVAEVDGFTLRITDPAAPGEGAFYKIELSPGKAGTVASPEFGH